jgi:hypothetical protein
MTKIRKICSAKVQARKKSIEEKIQRQALEDVACLTQKVGEKNRITVNPPPISRVFLS